MVGIVLNNIAAGFWGSLPIEEIWIGNVSIYQHGTPLETPTNTSVSSAGISTWNDVEHAETYKTYVDGTQWGTVPANG